MRKVYRPKVDERVTGSSELTIILPSNLDNLSWLVEDTKRVFIDCIWFPDQNIGVFSS
jgi:hypothetical protein